MIIPLEIKVQGIGVEKNKNQSKLD